MIQATQRNWDAVGFYNTTGLIGTQLQTSVTTVANQNAVILEIFQQSNMELTPSEVLTYCEIKGFKYLITSVRRTINTLTNVGELIHTASAKMGPNGKPEGLWVSYK